MGLTRATCAGGRGTTSPPLSSCLVRNVRECVPGSGAPGTSLSVTRQAVSSPCMTVHCHQAENGHGYSEDSKGLLCRPNKFYYPQLQSQEPGGCVLCSCTYWPSMWGTHQ